VPRVAVVDRFDCTYIQDVVNIAVSTCTKVINYKSTLCTTATLGAPKKLFRGGLYSEVPPIKLVLILNAGGSDWSLLTGGNCSEVVVNTGLAVLVK
jgi:hypothetical protein